MTILLLIIFAISFLHLTVAALAFFSSQKLAGIYLDEGKYKRWWVFSCYVKSFFIVYILLWVAALAVALQIDTEFFTKTTIGIILGMGVVLNLFATAVWWFFSQMQESALKAQVKSMEKALKKNERGWKRKYFNRRNEILLGDDSEARKEFIESMALKEEPHFELICKNQNVI